jgi:predicted deacylase
MRESSADRSEQPLWADFRPASRNTFSLSVNLKDGTVLPLPGYVVRGAKPGPTLYVHASQHGTELNGIKAILEIVASLDPQELCGTLVAVPVSNPLAIRSRSYLPPGETNANRSWPGDPNGENVQRIVYALYDNLVRHADAVLDYHGINDRYASAIWMGDKEYDMCIEMAKAFGVPCIELIQGLGDAPRTPITPGIHLAGLCAREMGISGITVEMRGEMVTRSDSTQELMLGAYNVMKWLKMLPGEPQKPPFRIGGQRTEIVAPMEGLYYPEVEPGALVGEGTLLGKLVSFSTLKVEEIQAPLRGFVYMNGAYEPDGHTLNDIANEGEGIVIMWETMDPDDPSWQPPFHKSPSKKKDAK